ncbi:MAG TPA: hypothetical protein VLK79_06645 [Gaiellales bacterium]|nr:hypothetical protein [Gaiellales bacterium]
MMSTHITTQGARLVRRHPRRAVSIGLLTVSALRSINAADARRRAQHLAEPVTRAVSDRKVHAETRRAKADALHAAQRVQRIGVASALTDKRVARKLRHATHHASRAASLSIGSPRRHRVRNSTIAVVAASALAGAAYVVRPKIAMVIRTAEAPIGSDQSALDAEAAAAAAPTETQTAAH